MRQVSSKPLSKAIGMKDAELSDPEDDVDVRIRSVSTLLSTNISLIPLRAASQTRPQWSILLFI